MAMIIARAIALLSSQRFLNGSAEVDQSCRVQTPIPGLKQHGVRCLATSGEWKSSNRLTFLCNLTQVMRRIICPLPDPETVPIEPTRLLRETAAKKGYTVRFLEVKEEDHSFTVHVLIDQYLLARCKLTL